MDEIMVHNRDILNLKKSIIYASFGDDGVIFNLDDRLPHELNKTGILILDLLDGKKCLGELIREFSIRCGQTEDIIKKDVILFLENLMERGWIYVR